MENYGEVFSLEDTTYNLHTLGPHEKHTTFAVYTILYSINSKKSNTHAILPSNLY